MAIGVILLQIYVDLSEKNVEFFAFLLELAKDKKIFQYLFSLAIIYPVVIVVFSSIAGVYEKCFSSGYEEIVRRRNKGLVGTILGLFAIYIASSIILDTFNYDFTPLTIENLGLKGASLSLFLATTGSIFLLVFFLAVYIDEKFMGVVINTSVLCLLFVYFTTSIRSYMIGALIGSWIAISFASFLADNKKEKIKMRISRIFSFSFSDT